MQCTIHLIRKNRFLNYWKHCLFHNNMLNNLKAVFLYQFYGSYHVKIILINFYKFPFFIILFHHLWALISGIQNFENNFPKYLQHLMYCFNFLCSAIFEDFYVVCVWNLLKENRISSLVDPFLKIGFLKQKSQQFLKEI